LAALVVPAAGRAEPPGVPVSRPVQREVTDALDFTGRTRAAETVELRARVTGYLEKVLFREGDMVRKGDVLFEIDARPYQAALEQAKANLTLAEAQLKLAESNLRRAEELLKRGNLGKEDYDKAVADRAEAQARVAAARAAVEVAQLNHDWTRARAPISGRIGRRALDVGNLVRADETSLGQIVSTGPIHVYFDMDERSYLRYRRAQPETGKAEQPVLVGLGDEKGFPHQGRLDVIDPTVDAATGTVRVRAVLPNDKNLLVPGLFVRVRLPLGKPREALLVAEQAVGSAGDKRFVLVVNDKNVVERRPVELGALHDGLRVVERGLTRDDRVVVRGVGDLRPGVEVKPDLIEMPRPEKE
jgi:RND family efflux transporter MFP subunit